MVSLEQAREAKATLRRALAERDGVTGIGLTRAPVDAGAAADPARAAGGEAAVQAQPAQDAEPPEDTWCLQVNVVDADALGEVPHEVDGVAVVVRVTGHVGAG